MINEREPELQFIDRWEVIKKLCISESKLEKEMIRDENFPKPRRVGMRSIRWLKHEVEAYILAREEIDYFA